MRNIELSDTIDNLHYGQRYAYPDLEPYDDDYPEYCFFEPVAYADNCQIGDCWIVNEQGEICPGYRESPVPINSASVKRII